MGSVTSTQDGVLSSRTADLESAEWVRTLGDEGPAREEAATRLHGVLLGIARRELARRARPLAGLELDDLAHQAADDALLAIVRKLGEFRGESRFTTWAHRFVVLEVSAKLARLRRRTGASLEGEDPERLPDRLGPDPARESERRDLLASLRRAVERELTVRQRRIFVALVLRGMPLDALAAELDSNRNAIYKSLFDARRKLRASLAADGYLEASSLTPVKPVNSSYQSLKPEPKP